jgi:Membrane protein involved in the export of O-antigen and teichoic acid
MRKQSTVQGFTYLTAAVMTVKVLSLLYLPFLIGILGDEGYGIYAAAYQIFAVIYAVTNSGLPQAISKLMSELTAVGNYKDAVKAFRLSRSILLCFGILFSLAFLIFGRQITNMLHYPRSYYGVLALAPTIFLSTITTSYRGYFQGRQNMTPTAVSQVLEQIVNIMFTLLLAWLFLKYGVEISSAGGAFATTVAALVAVTYLSYLYRKHKEVGIVRFHNPAVSRYSTKELIKKIFYYSLPLTAYTLMYNIGAIIDLRNTKTRLLFAGFTESEATKMYGYLIKYTQLIGFPVAIIISLSVALMPSISAARAIKDENSIANKINLSYRLCFIIVTPVAVIFTIMSQQIYGTMKFGGGAYLLVYGSYVLIIMASVQITSSILQGIGRLYSVSLFMIIGIAGKIIVNYILIGIPQINILGAILGNTVYYLIPLILGNYVLKRCIRGNYKIFTHALKPFISSLGMGASVFIIYLLIHDTIGHIFHGYLLLALSTIIAVLAGIFIYVYLLILMGGISKNDLELIPSSILKYVPDHMLNLIKARRF